MDQSDPKTTNAFLECCFNTKIKFKTFDAVLMQEESNVDAKACIKEELGGEKVNGSKWPKDNKYICWMLFQAMAQIQR